MANVWTVKTLRDRETPRGPEPVPVELIEQHGSLMRPIFGDDVMPLDLRQQEATVRRDVLPFSSADDLVLTVGPQVMVAVLAALLMAEHGSVRFLVWDRQRRTYASKWIGAATRPADPAGS